MHTYKQIIIKTHVLNIQIKKIKHFQPPEAPTWSSPVIAFSHFQNMPALLLFVIFYLFFFTMIYPYTYHQTTEFGYPHSWTLNGINLLCLASFTQCCFHNSSKLCVAVIHSFSLLYSILWICHNFSIVDGIFGSLWTIMKNSSTNLLPLVL